MSSGKSVCLSCYLETQMVDSQYVSLSFFLFFSFLSLSLSLFCFCFFVWCPETFISGGKSVCVFLGIFRHSCGVRLLLCVS